MSRNANYNRNRNGNSDNNEQSTSEVHGGEFRNGRKSQFKNNNPRHNQDTPNEFINNKDH